MDVNSRQFERWLRSQGIEVREKKAGGGHKMLINPATGLRSEIPSHGGRKQLGTGLMAKIKRDLGLK